MTKKDLTTLETIIKDYLQYKPSMIITIEGPSGSGKTTLAKELSLIATSSVFSLDDFFLPPNKKTPERLMLPGGIVDYERFKEEVIDNLNNKKISYHRYDCHHEMYEKIETVINPLVIIEGVYSAHPYFGQYYDYLIYLDINLENQLERIKIRSGIQMLNRFINEWIPLENKYFSYYQIKEKASKIILNDNYDFSCQ